MNHQMEQEILGVEEDFEVCDSQDSKNPDELFFNSVVQALQEIIIDEEFENSQTGFMRDNCYVFQNVQENKTEYVPLFQQYQANVSQCLEKVTESQIQLLHERIPDFSMQRFVSMLPTRQAQIDEQILEILTSFSDFQVFKQLMIDYKAAIEEEERYRILTVKTNKVSEHKKVKGASQNIFGTSKPLSFGNEPLKRKVCQPKAEPKIEKAEEDLFVPDLVLTIRPLRKQ